MQNAGMAELGLDWRYLAAEVPPDDLRAAIHGAKAMRFIGLNLTVPHKMLALEMVDVVGEKAKLLGAVNTIVFETRGPNGAWVPLGQVPAEQVTEIRSHGHNTDADSFIKAIKEEFPMAGLCAARPWFCWARAAQPARRRCGSRRKASAVCSSSIARWKKPRAAEWPRSPRGSHP